MSAIRMATRLIGGRTVPGLAQGVPATQAAQLAADRWLSDLLGRPACAERSDDAVAAFAETCGVPCWRGALDDVLGRLRAAVAACQADDIVRVSGDSPLIDPAIVATAVELYLDGTADIVTNVFPCSVPKGQCLRRPNERVERGRLPTRRY